MDADQRLRFELGNNNSTFLSQIFFHQIKAEQFCRANVPEALENFTHTWPIRIKEIYMRSRLDVLYNLYVGLRLGLQHSEEHHAQVLLENCGKWQVL